MDIEYRIETESPIADLREGPDFNRRAADWLAAAHRLVSDAIERDRQINGSGEEVELLLTARQADHLAMGLTMLASRFGETRASQST